MSASSKCNPVGSQARRSGSVQPRSNKATIHILPDEGVIRQQHKPPVVDIRLLGFINRPSTIEQLLIRGREIRQNCDGDFLKVYNDKDNPPSSITIDGSDEANQSDNLWTFPRASGSASFFHLVESIVWNAQGELRESDTAWLSSLAQNITLDCPCSKVILLMVTPGVQFMCRPLAQNLPVNHRCKISYAGSKKYRLDRVLNPILWSMYLAACALVDFQAAVNDGGRFCVNGNYTPPVSYKSTMRKVLRSIATVKVGKAVDNPQFPWQAMLTDDDRNTIRFLTSRARIYRNEVEYRFCARGNVIGEAVSPMQQNRRGQSHHRR